MTVNIVPDIPISFVQGYLKLLYVAYAQVSASAVKQNLRFNDIVDNGHFCSFGQGRPPEPYSDAEPRVIASLYLFTLVSSRPFVLLRREIDAFLVLIVTDLFEFPGCFTRLQFIIPTY